MARAKAFGRGVVPWWYYLVPWLGKLEYPMWISNIIYIYTYIYDFIIWICMFRDGMLLLNTSIIQWHKKTHNQKQKKPSLNLCFFRGKSLEDQRMISYPASCWRRRRRDSFQVLQELVTVPFLYFQTEVKFYLKTQKSWSPGTSSRSLYLFWKGNNLDAYFSGSVNLSSDLGFGDPTARGPLL